MLKVTALVSRVTNHISLVQGHDYEVIGIDDEHFRTVDESSEPSLHPKSFFSDCQIDPPNHWKYQDFGEGEYAYDPPQFASRGFFEDYADGKPAAVQESRDYLRRRSLFDGGSAGQASRIL